MQKIREIKLPKATDLALSVKNDTEDAKKTKTFCDSFKVQTNADLDMATKMLAEIKLQYAEYDNRKKENIQNILNVLEDITSFFRPALDALALAEADIKAKVSTCIENRLKTRDSVLERVQEAKPEDRALLIEEADKLLPPKIAGLSSRENWKVEIVDPNKAFFYLVENKMFAYLSIDKKTIAALVKAKDKDPGIPGIIAKKNRSVIISPKRVA